MVDECAKRIWLLPNAGNDGETLWCDDPAPGVGMVEADAVEYVRADALTEIDRLRMTADDLLKTVYHFINCWADPFDDTDEEGKSLYEKETQTNVRLLGASADRLRAALAALNGKETP